jgi:hypothetical protein
MTPDPTPEPGSLTVPPLFGWEGIVVLLVLAVVIGVGYLVLSAMSASRRPSADWDEWLQGRSRDRHATAPGPGTPRTDPASGRTGERYGVRRSG